ERGLQGRRGRVLSDCTNTCERGGLRRVRSSSLISSPNWMAYEYPNFQGQQIILEKGDHSCYQLWARNSIQESRLRKSMRPLVPQNHSDSPVTLFEGDNFQVCRFEHSDDYPSLPSMGWASRDVGSLKVSSEAWVAYQYPGYQGYQYVLEQEELHTYSEFGTQVHTGQLQS
uniref:Beta-crystallin A2 n=1 Tax=Myotis lucifugus TaxID=59463 RepID=G1Q5N6_MYOLU